MANPVLFLLSMTARLARARLLRQTSQADQVQAQFLRSLLTYHKDTEFGQRYGLGSITTIDQFRERLPILAYTDFEPDIDRMAEGETNILTPDPVIFFNLTSGTTGKKKLIPVTQRSRRAITQANQAAMGMGFVAADRQQVPVGKMLFTSSAKSMGTTPGGVAYGPVSTSDLRLANVISRQIFVYPFEALQIGNGLARHYVCLLFAMQNPQLRVIGATFPVLALRLCKYLEEHTESLLQDLETGAIANWLDIDPDLRQALERQLTPSPQRAANLRQIFNQTGRLTPHDLWPNLSFLITARGGTSSFYFERFPDYFANTPIFGGTYASAEATFGVHRDFNTDSVILALDSGFFEFVPESAWEENNPKTLLPWELTVGDRYRIVVTNYSGFYRYDLGDVVEVEGFMGNTPLIIFRHRRGGVISASTEKTTEFHVTQVMQALQQDFHISLENFCITLSDTIPVYYLVNIELASGSTLNDPTHFLNCFDSKLKEVHVSYAVKRVEQVPKPHLRILAPGSFAELRRRMIARGVSETQIKFPLVSGDRAFLQGLTIEKEIVNEA